jgi:hypothetical protein
VVIIPKLIPAAAALPKLPSADAALKIKYSHHGLKHGFGVRHNFIVDGNVKHCSAK